MEKIEERKQKLLKNKYLLILLAILVFAFIIRLYYFNINTAIWYDAGDYLNTAKRIGLPLKYMEDTWYYRRTFLLPLIWALLYRVFGNHEIVLRFSEVIFSMIIVGFTYFVAKEMFNKRVAIWATCLSAVSWLFLFFTARLLSSIPAASLMWVGLFFVWKGYINNKGNKFIYLGALFVGLSIMIRFSYITSLFPFFVLFLLKDRLSIFKKKQFWLFFIIILLILTPFFYLYHQHYPNSIKDFLVHYTGLGRTGEESGEYTEGTFWPYFLGFKGIWIYTTDLFINLRWPFFIIFLAGSAFLLLDLVLGLDLIFKKDNFKIKKTLFMLIWIFTPIVVHGMMSEYLQERYLMYAFPMVYIVTAFGFNKLDYYLSKYSKVIAKLALIAIFIFGSYHALSYGHNLIMVKKDTYNHLRFAGEWLKENTNKEDLIISAARPQLSYYAERNVHGFPAEEENLTDDHPQYMVLTVWEKSPDWTWTYPTRHPEKVKPIQGWFLDKEKTQAAVIIFEFIY